MNEADRLAAFVSTLPVTRGPGSGTGERMSLRPWERAFLDEVFGDGPRVMVGVLTLGRGGGKTSFGAALALASLVGLIDGPDVGGWPRREVYLAARDEEQAAIAFRDIKAWIEHPDFQIRDPDSGRRLAWFGEVKVRTAEKRIDYLPDASLLRVLSSDASASLGTSPTLALCDEVGAWRGGSGRSVTAGDDLFDALQTGAVKVGGRILAVSTQAAEDEDRFSRLVDLVKSGLDARVRGVVYEAPAGCDLDDEDAIRAANPHADDLIPLADLVALARQSMGTGPSAEANFRRLVLNQRISVEEVWLHAGTWAGNLEGEAAATGPAYVGVHVGGADYPSAAVAYWPSSGRVEARGWLPAARLDEFSARDGRPYSAWLSSGLLSSVEGSAVSLDDLMEAVRAWCVELRGVRRVVVPRSRRADVEGACARRGLDFRDALWDRSGSYAEAGADFDAAERVISAGGLSVRRGAPLLTSSVLGVVPKADTSGQRAIDWRKSRSPVDAAVALTYAMGAASRDVVRRRRGMRVH